MSDLLKKNCFACDGNIPPFDINEIHKYLKKVDGWDVKSNNDKNFYRLLLLEKVSCHCETDKFPRTLDLASPVSVAYQQSRKHEFVILFHLKIQVKNSSKKQPLNNPN